MPYTATTWTDGTTAVNQSHMNNLETQYTEASNSFEQDLFTAFVLSGLVASKDGSINNQLDVTTGVAFLKQTDGTLRRRAPVSSTQTTATPSTTYYLFLNNDGTWTWGTTSTGPTNSLAICTVTTDGSGNILVVTDKRTLTTTLLSSMAGALALVDGLSVTGGTTSLDNGTITTDGSGNLTKLGNITFSNGPTLTTLQSGSANGVSLKVWSGSAGVTPLSVGGQFNSARAWIDQFGDVIAPAFVSNNGTLVLTSQQSGAANGAYIKTWSGSAAVTPFSVGGQYNSALAYVDASGNITAPSFIGPVTQVGTTNAGSGTTPQVKAATNTGISVEETTSNSKTLAAIIPTEGNSTLRGFGFGYTDSGGTFHLNIQSDDGAALRYAGNGGIYRYASYFSGTGSGTYSHGLPSTPSWVGATDNNASSSMTIGAASIGSSTVVMTCGASHAFLAVATG